MQGHFDMWANGGEGEGAAELQTGASHKMVNCLVQIQFRSLITIN